MDFVGAFGFLCYFILLVTIGLAVGVFFYSRLLLATQDRKDAELVAAQANIDTVLAQEFVRLHDRITSSQSLLDNHIAFSNFLTSLEALLPTTVRFSLLGLVFSDAKSVALTGSGTAKSFNALAAASASLSTDGRIRDAIFSHITVNKDNSVSFSLAATLNQQLITFVAPPPMPLAPPAATTTASSTTPTP